MKNAVIGLIAIASGSPIFASGWSLETRTDAMTDRIVRQAYVESDTGDKVVLSRKTDGTVWLYFTLGGRQMFEPISSITIRVDKNTPRELDDSLERMVSKTGGKFRSWTWSPNIVGALIWHGKPEEGCGVVYELLKGDSLVVRYRPTEATVVDTTFKIGKNKAALSSALNVDLKACGIK